MRASHEERIILCRRADLAEAATYRNREVLGGSGTRSIILDHAYRIAPLHSASLDHPGRSPGHSRDFHSSGREVCPRAQEATEREGGIPYSSDRESADARSRPRSDDIALGFSECDA